jgi:hypothetical protein
MENRHAIRVRNLVAAVWAAFSVPLACIWVLIADRHRWLDAHPALAITVAVSFFGPIVFLVALERYRRKLKIKANPKQSQATQAHDNPQVPSA